MPPSTRYLDSQRPTVGLPHRDVSPVGHSRFEQPFEVAPPTSKSRSNTTSATTLPTSPSSYKNSMPFGKAAGLRNQARGASDSIFSTETTETAPTSIEDNNDHELQQQVSKTSTEDNLPTSPVCIVSPDDWFARFRSDSDIGLTDTDECPDRATLAAVNSIPIYDAEGVSRPFGDLYNNSNHQRQLIIFVRHFYCGACQAYLKALTTSITIDEYFSIPIPTSIIVIGCGQPDLIPQYKKFSGNCPFPIFADPSRKLFKKLGMSISFNLGRERPEYMRDISTTAWINGQVTTIRESLNDKEDGIRKRDVVRGGNPMQIGGEFLFEEGEVIWCHRMRNYRNHAEVKVIRKLLELDE